MRVRVRVSACVCVCVCVTHHSRVKFHADNESASLSGLRVSEVCGDGGAEGRVHRAVPPADGHHARQGQNRLQPRQALLQQAESEQPVGSVIRISMRLFIWIKLKFNLKLKNNLYLF